MKEEFQRYQLSSQRNWIGALQIAGAIGLLAGLKWPGMGQAAATGLALMMLIAVGVRFKIKNNLLQTMPAMFYLGLNTYLAISGF